MKQERKVYIVYEGPEFTIEWYYNSTGKSPAKEYLIKKV